MIHTESHNLTLYYQMLFLAAIINSSGIGMKRDKNHRLKSKGGDDGRKKRKVTRERPSCCCSTVTHDRAQISKEGPLRQEIDLPEYEEDGVDVSDEDMEFVMTHGHQIGFLKSLDRDALDRCETLHVMKAFHSRVGILPSWVGF